MNAEERERFRDAARRRYASEDPSSDWRLTVPLHANVQPCEGGAFVEAVVWVPARSQLGEAPLEVQERASEVLRRLIGVGK